MATLAQPLDPPARLERRRADRAVGRISRDRLVSMAVLAAMLHGIVILGITFSRPPVPLGGTDNGIEVLLVSDELPEASSNESAVYLSQRTQAGSGNTQERQRAQVPRQAKPGEAATAESQDSESLEEQVLMSTRDGRTRILVMPLPATAETQAAERGETGQASDEQLRLRGERRDELYVTADTRASRLAPYLDAWRRRVERIGTINYPSVANRQDLHGNPVIEVALSRDGTLASARIQRSSGHPEIDAAALDILRLASPFDPFPEELARDYRVLRFAYEWQFSGGRPVEGTLTVP